MQQEDIQQISNLLDQKLDQKFKDNNEALGKEMDQKLDQKFKDNNEVLIKRMDEKIDELAVMVKGGFDEVDKRFDEVDKRFDRVDEKLGSLEKGHEDITLRLDKACPVR